FFSYSHFWELLLPPPQKLDLPLPLYCYSHPAIPLLEMSLLHMMIFHPEKIVHQHHAFFLRPYSSSSFIFFSLIIMYHKNKSGVCHRLFIYPLYLHKVALNRKSYLMISSPLIEAPHHEPLQSFYLMLNPIHSHLFSFVSFFHGKSARI